MFIPLELFLFVILEKSFLFLLRILLNSLRNLFIFCVTVDIDEILLLEKKKGHSDQFFYSYFPSFSYLAKWFKESFLLLHKC